MVYGSCNHETNCTNINMLEIRSSPLVSTSKNRFGSILDSSSSFGNYRFCTSDTPVPMSVIRFVFIFFSLLLFKSNLCGATVTVTEVAAGHLAELPCLSSDDHHRFMFWQLTDNRKIIGPGNPMDENKYNYEVLTGKLFIRGVSTAESGFYKCISKGISDHSAINIHVVELIVKKDWEDVWENDFETNLLRGMAAVMVIVVGIAIVLFIITTKRRQSRRFFDLEESRENSPAKYTPNVTIGGIASTPTLDEGGIDNAALDIDFPKVFRQMQK